MGMFVLVYAACIVAAIVAVCTAGDSVIEALSSKRRREFRRIRR